MHLKNWPGATGHAKEAIVDGDDNRAVRKVALGKTLTGLLQSHYRILIAREVLHTNLKRLRAHEEFRAEVTFIGKSKTVIAKNA